jgi:hypothetical protein
MRSSLVVFLSVLITCGFSSATGQAQVVTDGLVALFDAAEGVISDGNDVNPDGETVLVWEDQSTDENFYDSDIIVGTPRLTDFTFANGDFPAVYFDGASGVALSNDGLLQPAAGGQLTIYALVVPVAGQSQCIFANYIDVCGFGLGVSDNLAEEVKWFTATPIASLESGVKDLFAGETTLLHVDYDAGDKVCRKNGAILAQESGVSIDFTCGATQLTLGYLDFGRQFFTGWIAEIAVYNTVHDGAQRLQMENYFSGKYGVTAGFLGPEDLVCGTGAPGTVIMDWINNDPADSIEIYRDGILLESLSSDADTFTDEAVPLGDHQYELRAHKGAIFASRTCEILDRTTPQLSALTFYGTTGDGTVRPGERWNTLYPDFAWDVAVYADGVITDQGDVDQANLLNRPNDVQVKIPMTPGEHTFGIAVARNDEFANFFGLNLFFDGKHLSDSAGISVFGNASDVVPGNGLFLANGALDTMGWPITSTPGSGTTVYVNCDLDIQVELTEFQVYTQPALGIDILPKQEPGTRNLKTDPAPQDGFSDVQAQFTLVVTSLGGDCTPALAPPVNMTCGIDPTGDTVTLNWENQVPYDQIRVFEDENQIALLAGDATTHTEGIPNTSGDHIYRIQAELDDQQGGPSCSITIFDSLNMTAMTLNAATDGNGGVNLGERWNTLHGDGAWDIGIREDGVLDAVADYDPADITDFWLNDPVTGAFAIPMVLGETRTFTMAVSRSPLDVADVQFYNVNLYFNGQQDPTPGRPGISVLAEQSLDGPDSGGPFPAFFGNGSDTMGWPIAGVAGAGSLTYDDPVQGLRVEMTNFVIYNQLAPGEGLGVDFGSSGGSPGYPTTLADGDPDLVAEFTLAVTSLDGGATGACCTAGNCDTVTQADCDAGAGAYQGDGTNCGGITCPAPGGFRRGDHDGSGIVDITDPLNLLGFLFLGQTPPICGDASDGDNSNALDISDALNVLGFLFLGSFPLNETLPGPQNCGSDPTTEIDPDGPGGFPPQPVGSLGCDLYPSATGISCAP